LLAPGRSSARRPGVPGSAEACATDPRARGSAGVGERVVKPLSHTGGLRTSGETLDAAIRISNGLL
jgi:hypothetical protein